ncbi:MAG: tRNA 2-thiouridine(34) synthase MnmA [Candidatus Omnitrophica bacterium]|nr:tRNA 2-thiouridine(34) synthase MnmA [Candidatus Omnitrophota bacterium]
MEKVMVAMSGGVDSSVAAYLLKQQGHEVIGVTMCLGIPDDTSNKRKCCGVEAINDVKSVCAQLNIPYYVLDFSNELSKYVIDDFISEYKSGRTPNPCARCNQYLKFGKLLEYAKNLGFNYLATGHYAKIIKTNGKVKLACPKDSQKDQTYFLYNIRKENLKYILFPLAKYSKNQVRQIAKDANLTVAEKQQSQDICFVPNKNYKEFIVKRIQSKPGDIVTEDGKILGQHNGIINFTIGQRSGLGIAAKNPLYVLRLNQKNNQVVVGERHNLQSKSLMASNLNFLVDKLPKNISAKIRYAHKKTPCQITLDKKNNTIKVSFDEPQESITPGQSIVFYSNDIVCAGGTIQAVID